jgi:hypothetical protein
MSRSTPGVACYHLFCVALCTLGSFHLAFHSAPRFISNNEITTYETVTNTPSNKHDNTKVRWMGYIVPFHFFAIMSSAIVYRRGSGTPVAFVDETRRSVQLLCFRIARIPHCTLRLDSICMGLRARLLGILGRRYTSCIARQHHFGPDCQLIFLRIPSLLVLANPRQSRLILWWFWL